MKTYDNITGEKVALQQFSIFHRGAGGFNGKRSSSAERAAPSMPDGREPDKVVEEHTHPDQAALYRLGGGDLNPLHIDPEFAHLSGFSQPVLHGLCFIQLCITKRNASHR